MNTDADTAPVPAPVIGGYRPPAEGSAAALALRSWFEGYPEAKVAVYQCHALGDPRQGDFTYLVTGPGFTFRTPPPYCPGPQVWHAMSPFVGVLTREGTLAAPATGSKGAQA